MILLCPVTCSAHRKIIIMIIKTPTAFPAEETQAFDFSSGPFSRYQICPWQETAQRHWPWRMGEELRDIKGQQEREA